MIFIYELIKIRFTNFVFLYFVYNFTTKKTINIINKLQIITWCIINLFKNLKIYIKFRNVYLNIITYNYIILFYIYFNWAWYFGSRKLIISTLLYWSSASLIIEFKLKFEYEWEPACLAIVGGHTRSHIIIANFDLKIIQWRIGICCSSSINLRTKEKLRPEILFPSKFIEFKHMNSSWSRY